MKVWRGHSRLGVALLVAVVICASQLWTGLTARASHAAGWHLDSIHLSYDDEDFCVNSTGTSQPWRWIDAYQNAVNALWGNSDDSHEWDAKAWDLGGPFWRVWFVGHSSNPCQNLSAAERGPIEIEMWIEDDTRSGSQPYYCGGPADVSCAVADHPVLFAGGHWNYEFYYLLLYKPYAVGDSNPDGSAHFAWHQINHETGHALGFADGTGSGDCPSSVMHSRAYGCSTNLRYPSTGDVSSEVSIAFSH